MQTDTAVLELRNLARRYGKVEAVNGLSLDRGTASGKFLLTRAPGRGPGMWLDATTSGAAVKLPGSLPALEAVDGRVTFAGTDYASFDGTAAMAGGR